MIITCTDPIFSPCHLILHGNSIWNQIKKEWENPPTFKLFEDWSILVDGTEYFFPKRFITDFASIPRLLWSLIEPNGPLLYGAIPHDLGYQYGYLLTKFQEGNVYPEKSLKARDEFKDIFGDLIPVHIGENHDFFDNLLKEITIAITGAEFQAFQAYIALKIFGNVVFNNYRKKGVSAYGINSLGFPGVNISGNLEIK